MTNNSERDLIRWGLSHDKGASHQPAACVAQVMQSQILQCDPERPLDQAAELMSRSVCSSILVVDRGNVVGIWTEHDALRLDLDAPDTFSVPIHEVMSSPVKTVHLSDDLNEVAERFTRDHVRHYLVVNDGHEPVGVITQTDVVMNQGLEYYLRLRSVSSVVTHSPPLVPADTTVSEAANLMREQHESAVVTRIGSEYGILTERDIVRLIARHQSQLKVTDCASHPLFCVEADTSLYRTRLILHEHGVRHIGVLSNADGTEQELIGLISLSDIMVGVEQLYIDELKGALQARETALKISTRNLRLAERVIANSLEGVMITSPDGTIESVNPAFTTLTGYTADEVIGKTPSVLNSGHHESGFYHEMWSTLINKGHWRGEVWNRRKNGELFPELLTITAIHDEDGNLTHYAALFRDITELKQSEQQIRNLAYYDPLTGLPNRRLFHDRLSVALSHAHRSHSRLALVYIDLDRFKRINDSLGHSVGDQVLVNVSERIHSCLHEDDTLARMGGDEFVAIIGDISDSEDGLEVARCIGAKLSTPFTHDEQQLVISASMGISLYPDDGEEYDTLLNCADTAMYRAKVLGRNSYQLYTPGMDARSTRQLSMESAMLRGLERDEFCVHIQPLVRADGSLYGGEALLRWEHPELGLISPADFIPLAEENGLIIPLSDWVMEQVCNLSKHLDDSGHPLCLSFNISARQFQADDFIRKIEQSIERSGCRAEALVLELTESLLIEDGLSTIRQLNQLHAIGLSLALDDFGTGYSSLSYLKRFPLQTLKIDRIFVRDIDTSERDAALASAIINMADSLGLEVVAEGVENETQSRLLRDAGCKHMQGFLFYKPLPIETFVDLVKQGRTTASNGLTE